MRYEFEVDYSAQDKKNISRWVLTQTQEAKSAEKATVVLMFLGLLPVFILLIPGAWNVWGILIAISAAAVIGYMSIRKSVLLRITASSNKCILPKSVSFMCSLPLKAKIDSIGFILVGDTLIKWWAWEHIAKMYTLNNIIILVHINDGVTYIPMQCIYRSYGERVGEVIGYMRDKMGISGSPK